MDMLAKSFRQSEGPVTGKDFKVQWMWDGGHRYAQVGAIEVVYHSGTLIFDFRDIFQISVESIVTDTGEGSKLFHRRIWPKVDASIFFFFRRVRATSMTQRRVENTRVHF